MQPSLRALLTRIIDYAGLFPPAQLPLDEALRRYARYRTEPESWMLAWFVCPVDRLAELEPYRDTLLQEGEPFPFAVLVKIDAPTTKDQLAYDLPPDDDLPPELNQSLEEFFLKIVAPYLPIDEALAALQKVQGSRVRIRSFDVRLARWALADMELYARHFGEFLDSTVGRPELLMPMTFFEHELEGDWQTSVAAVITHLQQDPLRRTGYKLRCGGLHASTFPSVEQVASVLITCRDAGVPLKFTAGLHHPLRHYDTGLQTHMHGFLNVFGAGVLAHARQIDEETVRAIVADEEPRHFVFEEDGFRWNDLRASVEEITTARQQAVISFGSCSFDEPRDDLRRLGLLDV